MFVCLYSQKLVPFTSFVVAIRTRNYTQLLCVLYVIVSFKGFYIVVFTVTGFNVCVCVCGVSLSSWADAATNLNHISASFDQEASAVVMARMAVTR